MASSMVNFTFILRYNMLVPNSFQLSIMLHITSDIECPEMHYITKTHGNETSATMIDAVLLV